MSETLLSAAFSRGGVSGEQLSLATATPADVLKGKTFYSGDVSLKTGTLTKGERVIAYYLDWTSGDSFMNTLDTSLIKQLSTGNFGSTSGGSILTFLESGTYKIYAYISVSNDNINGYIQIGSETLIRAGANGILTSKTTVTKQIDAGASITIHHGGYSGCASILITVE